MKIHYKLENKVFCNVEKNNIYKSNIEFTQDPRIVTCKVCINKARIKSQFSIDYKTDKERKLIAENRALKDTIKFLRKQIKGEVSDNTN